LATPAPLRFVSAEESAIVFKKVEDDPDGWVSELRVDPPPTFCAAFS
jgi:hypothetical protein